jgi:hypothetical protein
MKDRDIIDAEEDILKMAGKFYGDPAKKFAGSPKGMLAKVAEKTEYDFR